MAIQNRDLDPSIARVVIASNVNSTPSGVSAGILNPGLSTGVTFPLCTVSSASQLLAASEAAWGLSGAPVHSLWLYRFIAGAGFTSMVMGQTWTVTAFGTSGAIGFSLPGGGSWNLLPGDQLVLYTQGSNAAVASAQVTVVLKELQDIRQDFGV